MEHARSRGISLTRTQRDTMTMNALQAAPQGKNRPTMKGKMTPSKMEGKTMPATRRDIPEVQPSSGAIPKRKWKEALAAKAAPPGKNVKAMATSTSASISHPGLSKKKKNDHSASCQSTPSTPAPTTSTATPPQSSNAKLPKTIEFSCEGKNDSGPSEDCGTRRCSSS